MTKKLFTLLLAVAASVGTLFAESGTCGDNLTWDLTGGVLTISGTGAMASYYTFSNHAPWYDNHSSITSVIIENGVTSIGVNAFSGCTGLTSVTIPNSVTSIGESAFSYCSGLISIEIPNSVTSIVSGTFSGCSGLTSVTIPNSVTSIGEEAFEDCSGLTSVTIPNSVTSIGDWAFKSCRGLTSIEIPNSVTSIGSNAFSWCTGLISIEIPNRVTSIGDGTFTGCSGLTSVTIPNSVTSIGSRAFVGCSGLTSVVWNAKNCSNSGNFGSQVTSFTFGEEVEVIPPSACSGMTNLTFITIPSNVTSIGSSAFQGCSGLTSVVWNAKNCSNSGYFGSQVTSFTFGEEVEVIPPLACSDMTNLTSITIPNSVTSIGNMAFYGCSGLTSVTIGNSVTSIGRSAFYGCSGLTSVTITDIAAWCNIAFDGYSSNPLSYAKHLYVNDVEVTDLVIPNNVTSLGNYAFYNCSGLTSATIPNSVTSLGNYAFYNCSGVTSVEAPAGFFDVPEENWPYYTKILNQVVVNGGELTENALLFINRSYKTLQTLDVSGVTNTEFTDEAFKGCYNLQQLVLPAGLQKVSYMMVAGCINLQSINIPASAEEIEQRAFEDCRSIKSITFGGAPAGAPGRFNAPAVSTSQLRRIGNWAFYNAHELQNLEIPEGVTEIGDGAFYGCTYLEEMVLPSSVQEIGDNTFALCSKLKKINVNSLTPPTIQAKTFYDVKRQIPVYVPDESVDEYEGDTYWQEFNIQGISNIPQGLEEISSSLQGGDRGRLILHDGQIYILRDGKVYDLTGRKL